MRHDQRSRVLGFSGKTTSLIRSAALLSVWQQMALPCLSVRQER